MGELEPDYQSITDHPLRGDLNLFCERNIFYNVSHRGLSERSPSKASETIRTER